MKQAEIQSSAKLTLRAAGIAIFSLFCFVLEGASTANEIDLGPPFGSRLRAWTGAPSAPIDVICIEAFSCGHCKSFHERIFPELKRKYIDTKIVRWTTIPILSSGALAPSIENLPQYPVSFAASDPSTKALAIARWAAEQGKFWEMEEFLFHNPPVPLAEFEALLVRSQLMRADELLQVTSSQSKYFTQVRTDLNDCMNAHVAHTPTFIFRKRRSDKTFIEARVDGYQPLDYFDRLVTQLLSAP